MNDETRGNRPAELTTEAGQRFDHQWPGGTRIGRGQWRDYIADIESEARRAARLAVVEDAHRRCHGCTCTGKDHDTVCRPHWAAAALALVPLDEVGVAGLTEERT